MRTLFYPFFLIPIQLDSINLWIWLVTVNQTNVDESSIMSNAECVWYLKISTTDFYVKVYTGEEQHIILHSALSYHYLWLIA